MTTKNTRALLNPLILLYEDLAESRKLSRDLREARQSAAANGAGARTDNFSELVDTFRTLVQTSKVAIVAGGAAQERKAQDDSRSPARRPTQEGKPRNDSRSPEEVAAAFVGLAQHGRPPDESEAIGGAFDGAAEALDRALAGLRDERQDLIHPTQLLRDDDLQRIA